MARLIFDGQAIIGGVIITEYITKQNECLELCLFSTPSCFFCDTLTIKNDKVVKDYRLNILDWGQAFEIRALPLAPSAPPLAVKQKNHVYQGKEYLLTVYKDNSLKILFETDNEHFPFVPLVDIHSPQIAVNEINNRLFFTVTASCKHGRYILVLCGYPQVEKVFEEFGEAIEISDTDITVTKTIEDMLMRTFVATYSYVTDCFVIKSKMFNYSNEHMYINELKPYLLLEAIKAGDINYAKTLLDTALLDKAEYLSQFFGEIKEIDYPKYSNLSDDCVAVIDADNTIKIFKFDIKNHLISNITEL